VCCQSEDIKLLLLLVQFALLDLYIVYSMLLSWKSLGFGETIGIGVQLRPGTNYVHLECHSTLFCPTYKL